MKRFVPSLSDAADPEQELDLQDAKVVSELFNQAATENLHSPLREGAAIYLPAEGWAIMTGDLHDNGPNFQRISKLAALHQSPDRHLILHEVIHGPHQVNGCDLSIRMLARVAALKLCFPNQLHIVQSNHELAQLTGEGILKGGVSVVDIFNLGVDFVFHDKADIVIEAMCRFIRSLPLAVRSPNGLFFSHSLPSATHLKRFDLSLLDRIPTDADLRAEGDAHNMVWGRNHPQKVADTLSEAWDTKLFVMGHQPAEMGYEKQGDTMLILASDHTHGVALPVSLSQPYTMPELIDQIIPLASITL